MRSRSRVSEGSLTTTFSTPPCGVCVKVWVVRLRSNGMTCWAPTSAIRGVLAGLVMATRNANQVPRQPRSRTPLLHRRSTTGASAGSSLLQDCSRIASTTARRLDTTAARCSLESPSIKRMDRRMGYRQSDPPFSTYSAWRSLMDGAPGTESPSE